MSKKYPNDWIQNATMRLRFQWWRVSPLSSASFLKGIFLHHAFKQEVNFYKLGYYTTLLKILGRDRNITK